MDDMLEVIRQVAEHEARRIHTNELGIVTAVFPHKAEDDKENYQCSVRLRHKQQPDGSPFELRRVPIMTPYLGMVSIPSVGDLVLISFVGGDINAPIVIGRLHDDEHRPPVNKEQELLLRHTAGGGSIKLDDQGRIVITSKNEENVLTVEDERISLVNEKVSIVLDVSGGKISITANGDLELTAKDGKLALKGKSVELKADSSMDVSASGALTLKGQTIDLN